MRATARPSVVIRRVASRVAIAETISAMRHGRKHRTDHGAILRQRWAGSFRSQEANAALRPSTSARHRPVPPCSSSLPPPSPMLWNAHWKGVRPSLQPRKNVPKKQLPLPASRMRPRSPKSAGVDLHELCDTWPLAPERHFPDRALFSLKVALAASSEVAVSSGSPQAKERAKQSVRIDLVMRIETRERIDRDLVSRGLQDRPHRLAFS